ncbi:hypothetical protein N657DRAFT_680108 [Parathielavia appendiculata]|uniref:Uncharacterized protein n=1 Tax=Parathielavia appendiculata TaxID=2587402 RepID=A0AAN6U5C2_9PEZI|nr:hypothetical protein N657DRAFT_680108 [Parathielavia appendiculata]
MRYLDCPPGLHQFPIVGISCHRFAHRCRPLLETLSRLREFKGNLPGFPAGPSWEWRPPSRSDSDLDSEPLPAYTRWAIEAECPPPAHAGPPTGPPPSYDDSVRADLLGGRLAAPAPPPLPMFPSSGADKPSSWAGRVGAVPTPPRPRSPPSSARQRRTTRPSLEPPAVRYMRRMRLRAPPKISRRPTVEEDEEDARAVSESGDARELTSCINNLQQQQAYGG